MEKGEGIEPLRALQKGYHMRLKETTYTSIGVDLPEHVALVENIIRKSNVHLTYFLHICFYFHKQGFLCKKV
ncbi:MAG: hypothetical protein ACLTJ5_15370 [Clostridium sp.]